MKVILKQEVDNVGLAGDVADVADGYARNYLIPRGMAIVATRGAMREAEALTRSRRAAEAKTLDSARAAKDALEARTLQVKARVDDRGHLYGSVGVNDIHRVLRERGHQIEKKRIDLRGAIKEIGTYDVDIQVHPQVMATVAVEVLDEEGLVVAGQIEEPEIPPLPGEGETPATPEPTGDETVDALVQEAIQAAEQYEAERVASAADTDETEAEEASDEDAAEADETSSG